MGSCEGAFSLLFAMSCPDASWAFCCALFTLCERHQDHVHKPALLPESYHYHAGLCTQEELFCRSIFGCKCALLALPFNYWDILFISLLSSLKPITFENALQIMCRLLCMLSSSLLRHSLSFLGPAALRIPFCGPHWFHRGCFERQPSSIKLEQNPV